MAGPKEAAYDELIAPLMTQIIAVCKKHKIAMLADFALDPNEEGVAIKCTTALLSTDHNPEPEQLRAFEEVRPHKPAFMAFTISVSKGGDA